MFHIEATELRIMMKIMIFYLLSELYLKIANLVHSARDGPRALFSCIFFHFCPAECNCPSETYYAGAITTHLRACTMGILWLSVRCYGGHKAINTPNVRDI